MYIFIYSFKKKQDLKWNCCENNAIESILELIPYTSLLVLDLTGNKVTEENLKKIGIIFFFS